MQVITQLQRQVVEQQQVINTLMMNQQENSDTPLAARDETPVAPLAVPVAPNVVVRQEAYLIQWQRLKPESFAGASEPWDSQA